MRAMPLTDKSKPGGRPRKSRAPANPFATWAASCGMTPEELATALKVSISTIYNIRNGYFLPGRNLAVKIEELTRDKRSKRSAVPASCWNEIKVRERAARAAGKGKSAA